MGYTTSFSGTIELSKPLSLKTAKQWLDLAEDDSKRSGYARPCPEGYLQWVPTEDLRGIVWDGNEKFYDYTEWMSWVIDCLIVPVGIVADGILFWSGEDTADTGTLIVSKNAVIAERNRDKTKPSRKPLTRRRLTDLILETVP